MGGVVPPSLCHEETIPVDTGPGDQDRRGDDGFTDTGPLTVGRDGETKGSY